MSRQRWSHSFLFCHQSRQRPAAPQPADNCATSRGRKKGKIPIRQNVQLKKPFRMKGQTSSTSKKKKKVQMLRSNLCENAVTVSHVAQKKKNVDIDLTAPIHSMLKCENKAGVILVAAVFPNVNNKEKHVLFLFFFFFL